MVFMRSTMLPLRMLGLLMLILLQCDADSTCPSELNPLTLDPPELAVEYGQPVEVNCTSTDEEYEELFWNVPSTHKDGDVGLVSLIVDSISNWDVQAQCIIKFNETHSCSKDLLLTVYRNPESVTMFPVRHAGRLMEGTQYELQCDIINVAPVQKLTVIWYRGNEIIKTDTFQNMTKTPVSTSSVLMMNVSRKDNGNQLRCEAQLDFGPHGAQPPVVSNTQSIDVKYEPEVQCQSNVTGEEHSFYLNMLTCHADGNPAPKVDWYHQGRLINGSVPLTRDDSGEYDFRASNAVGNATATITVTIEYAPEFHQSNESLVKILVAEGTDVPLDCEVEGNPPPEVQWAYDAAGLNKLKTVENQSTLIIKGLKTTTTFYCIATNKLGNASKEIHVEVKTPSSAAPTEQPTAVASAPSETCPLELMPARVVVRYGDSVSVNCTTSTAVDTMGWEASEGGTGSIENVQLVTWKVQHLRNWDIEPKCYLNHYNNSQCTKTAHVTLYKTPDNVSISLPGHGGLMREGTEYQLMCTIINVAPVQNLTVRWYKDNETVRTPQWNIDTQKSPRNISFFLTITPSSNDNGVKFVCEAQLSLALQNGTQLLPTVTSAPYIADVQYKPLFQSCGSPFSGMEYILTLSMVPCHINGNPPPTVHWYHQGLPFNASEPLTRMHSGIFILEAVNSMGNSSISIDITVSYPPAFTCKDHYEIEENAEHKMLCKPEGEPEPRVTWFKDGKKMSFPMGLTRRHSGNYTLRAENEYGRADHNLYVEVLYAPEFQQENDTVEVTLGSNVFLNCSAEGNPSPKVQWSYPSEVNVKNTTRGQQGSVFITGATSTNIGTYICFATNKLGKVTRSTTLIMKDNYLGFIWVLVLVPLVLILLLLLLCYHRRRKHGQYDFRRVSTNDTNSIPLTPQTKTH